MRTIIITQPNMIAKLDYEELEKYCEVKYVEKEHVSAEELATLSKDFDCLMLNFDVAAPFEEKFYSLVKGGKLKFISCDITGMSWAFPESAKKNNIILTNTPNYCTEAVAEQVIAQIFLHSKKIHSSYMDKIGGKDPIVRKGFDLKGKTLGILGLGNIGSRVAELGNAIGMNVIAWNHTPKTSKIAKMMSKEDVLKNADVISINLKTTDETKKMINADLLKLCKPNAIIINQADGEIVVLDDIYNALINNKLGGYSGTFNETIKRHKIYKLDNATFEPANAWFSDESLNNLRKIWVNNVVEYFNGTIVNQVN